MRPKLKSTNYIFWVSLALFLKGIHFWSQVYLNYETTKPLIGHYTYDSNDYYDSMNNYYVNGVYTPDERMPGVGIIYLLFRPFLEHNTILNLILVLQWITTSVAVYVLSLLISKALNRPNVFYYIFFLASLTNYLSVWDHFLLSDSFCISIFVFALWYFRRFYESDSNKDAFVCGSLLAWCCFMRPVFILFYAVILLTLMIKFVKEKQGLKNILIKGLLLCSVFIIFDSLWIVRNYKVNHRLIVLNDIEWYSQISDSTFMPSLYLFMESWGGDLENELSWFELENIDYSIRDTTLPSFMYTSQFNLDSLRTIKRKIKLYKTEPNPRLRDEISLALQRYTRSVEEEKPFLNKVGIGFIYLKKLLFNDHWNTKRMNQLPPFRKTAAYSNSVVFYFIFFTGAIVSFFTLFRKRSPVVLKVLAVIALVNIVYITFGFKTPEFRYLLPNILACICFCGIWLEKISGRFIFRER